MSTISHAADVGFKFHSSQTCASVSLATGGTVTTILHSSSEYLLTVVELTRCSSHTTKNIHVTQLTSVDLLDQDLPVSLSSVPRLIYR